MQDALNVPADHPFSALTPDAVLDALDAVGLRGDGRLTALSSYENRVYRVMLESPISGADSVVAKFYRPGRWRDAQIAEEHAFAAELAAAEVPMVAPLALNGQTLHHVDAHDQRFAFSVSPTRGGRRPELDDFEVLEWIGRLMGRLHNVGAARPFVQRPALDAQTFGQASIDWLLAHDAIAPEVKTAWHERAKIAMKMIAIFALDDDARWQRIRLHGDCHPGNILWTPGDEGTVGTGPHFVDLDDARIGPAVQDLWMLLSGERRQRTHQLSALLDGYEQVREFDRRELALIEPLRTLRLIHYSAWLAQRFADPIFQQTFPWFGSADYWRGQVDTLDEQIEAMDEAPLAV